MAFQVMASAIAKCSKLSSSLHTSLKFKEAFDKTFNADGSHRGIPQPVVTRWNSTLRQVSSILKLDVKLLNDMLDGLGLTNLKLSSKDISQLKELVLLLKPFLEATDYTQGEKVQLKMDCYYHHHY